MESTKKGEIKVRWKRTFFSGFIVAMVTLCLLGCADTSKVEDAGHAATIYKDTPVPQAEMTEGRSTPVYQGKTFSSFTYEDIPDYTGNPAITVNGDMPFFDDTEDDMPYVHFGDLDGLGRPTAGEACLGYETMPDNEREGIDPNVRPAGWQQASYECISENSGYLYQRCHIIGWQLCGDECTLENLYTGTVQVNIYGQLPYENEVANYIRDTGNHVLYRVSPIYKGDELVCRGVLEEAFSVEDDGKGVCFCAFCYNVQEGVVIDYATGASRAMGGEVTTPEDTYVLNTRSKKFHRPECESVGKIGEKNKEVRDGKDRDRIMEEGYKPCAACCP